ncbi:LuxR C-terminal-related transcriptional regulator [Glutamicibacter sp. PS]|uniref:helix-turn-helix transcriptional regulator n=1 Tax=Glutamicibacter sp. PS TaxID=3075634 RepID=UPI00283DC37E|nr:LuxR C-terminal-related transcriptional regulator [Glutamicibacter sp. PS]MDR4534450.1 LuxR C-terminal-related transcriptional regulator [Glutamicibacter sp. PS]
MPNAEMRLQFVREFQAITAHPAIPRFQGALTGRERVLVVHAPPSANSQWFCATWTGRAPTEVIMLDDHAQEPEGWMGDLAGKLHDDPDYRAAVVTGSQNYAWKLCQHFDAALAVHSDVLLSLGEWRSWAQLIDPSQRLMFSANEMYRLAGGWALPLFVLATDPQGHTTAAQRLLTTVVLPWLSYVREGDLTAEASFLETFSDQALREFYGHYSASGLGIEELRNAGAVFQDHLGEYFMPQLMKTALRQRIEEVAPAKIPLLQDASLATRAKSGDVFGAMREAITCRNWDSLQQLVLEHGLDLFIGAPRFLSSIIAKIPAYVIDESGYLGIASRLLSMVDHGKVVAPVPTSSRNGERSAAVRKLAQQVDELEPTGGMKYVSLTLLYFVYLRLCGHYTQSADVAARLHESLQFASGVAITSPKLRAIAKTQIGVSLILDARLTASRWVLGQAVEVAQSSANNFLLADAAGKLALVEALNHNHDAARQLAYRSEQAARRTGWARDLVERSAILARGIIAWNELDADALHTELDRLPHEPDQDELWSVHAFLLAVSYLLEGKAARGRQLIVDLLDSRRYALGAFSAQVLNDALWLVTVLSPGGCQHMSTLAGNESSALRRLHGWVSGDTRDAQLSTATDAEVIGLWRPLTQALDVVERYHGRCTTTARTELAAVLSENAVAVRAMLSGISGFDVLLKDLELNVGQQRALAYLADLGPRPKRTNAPKLTPKELELLEYLRAGKTRRQIAVSTFRSENTVKTQMRSLYRKLDATDLAAALNIANRLGL